MTKIVDTIDATPKKRMYRSIIADYTLNTAVCELIDNAIDIGVVKENTSSLLVNISIDIDQQSIQIVDNAGGVKESDLRMLISPGDSAIPTGAPTIGIFGVGSKRAVVAVAQNIRITTRHKKGRSLRIQYDDEWLEDDSWDIDYTLGPKIDPNSTEIDLSKLRFKISQGDLDDLSEYLSSTYAKFLESISIEILLNGEKIRPRTFDKWAYPKICSPIQFTKKLKVDGSEAFVDVKFTGGLTYEKGSIAGDYGVFFYCNERLIARALKVPEVGFVSGIAGVPHPKMSFARVILELNGPAELMPWESNKAGINYNHDVFRAIQQDLFTSVKQFTKISAAIGSDFKNKIQPFRKGSPVKEILGKDEHIKPSKLPRIPKTRSQFKTSTLALNKAVLSAKPWARGAIESIIAEDVIQKQRPLQQKNRIALIILDSALEIAFKEYLANEITPRIGDKKLEAILVNRIDVHKEIEKRVRSTKSLWPKINYFYKLRCDLIHKRANTTISDSDLDQYRNIAKDMMRKLFGAKFPVTTD